MRVIHQAVWAFVETSVVPESPSRQKLTSRTRKEAKYSAAMAVIEGIPRMLKSLMIWGMAPSVRSTMRSSRRCCTFIALIYPSLSALRYGVSKTAFNALRSDPIKKNYARPDKRGNKLRRRHR